MLFFRVPLQSHKCFPSLSPQVGTSPGNKVYLATLPDGDPVLVKRRDPAIAGFRSKSEFEKEVEELGRLNHRNLVSSTRGLRPTDLVVSGLLCVKRKFGCASFFARSKAFDPASFQPVIGPPNAHPLLCRLARVRAVFSEKVGLGYKGQKSTCSQPT